MSVPYRPISRVVRLVRSALESSEHGTQLSREALTQAAGELGRLTTLAETSQTATREWLDAHAAVQYLGLPSRRALYQAVRRGQIPTHRLGKRRMRFRRAELDEVLQRGCQGPALDWR